MRFHAGLGGWLSTITVGVAAVILQSCVLAAMAGILGVAGFYSRMDRAPPSTALGCAIRCVLGGIGALAAALFLGVLLATHNGGWWQPSAGESLPALLALLAGMAIWLTSAPRFDELLAWPWPRALMLALPMAVLALGASASTGSVRPQCAFAAATSVLLAWTAWRLVCGAAPSMLVNARRR